MAHVELSPFVFNCALCHTRCDGVSKGSYQFMHDAGFSERYEQQIIQRINRGGTYQAAKNTEPGFPDLVITCHTGEIYRYLEVKVQRRTFMTVAATLPGSHLSPSETVALNLSDLLRYFDIEHTTGITTIIVWVVFDRPCIVAPGQTRMFFQTAKKLQEIYQAAGNSRRFMRKSGDGDVVEGVHKGVVVNYHFSLAELQPW